MYIINIGNIVTKGWLFWRCSREPQNFIDINMYKYSIYFQQLKSVKIFKTHNYSQHRRSRKNFKEHCRHIFIFQKFQSINPYFGGIKGCSFFWSLVSALLKSKDAAVGTLRGNWTISGSNCSICSASTVKYCWRNTYENQI